MNIERPIADETFPILRDPERLPQRLARPVVALGNFDGVHRGHAAVIARARDLAARLDRPCLVLTFEPHPADYFAGRGVVFRLTPEREKAIVMERLGLDGLIVLGFGPQLAALEAENFVSDLLVGRLNVAAAVAGYDFHFGKGRKGSPDFLREAGKRYGFEVEIIEKIVADQHGSLEAVHSGATREALEAGDVALARRLLGHKYFVKGEVIHGQKLGRTLGFPTANLQLDPSNKLRHGIYAVRIEFDGQTHDGVASWGRRPTVDNGAPLLEIYVFDFSGDLYGKQVEVGFVEWIRGEEKFDSLDTLVARIEQDAAEARAILAR
ncbi:MAG: bifunctional riboflavin kinase/FAD synthetase [Hyphomicrobiales bacterium]|nr:bifunctional riboflavin kinase/FAD synthetase [Hyphomicrobiales bacterium]